MPQPQNRRDKRAGQDQRQAFQVALVPDPDFTKEPSPGEPFRQKLGIGCIGAAMVDDDLVRQQQFFALLDQMPMYDRLMIPVFPKMPRLVQCLAAVGQVHIRNPIRRTGFERSSITPEIGHIECPVQCADRFLALDRAANHVLAGLLIKPDNRTRPILLRQATVFEDADDVARSRGQSC